MKIKIKKSITADTRSCDYTKVTKQALVDSTIQHCSDVTKALKFFSEGLECAGVAHDYTKFKYIDEFYEDFTNGFKTTTWYEKHKRQERHHINVTEGVRSDVNLIDVLEYISDCVMAGMARTGKIYELKLSDELLQRAFKNTVELLKENVEVEE